MKSLLLPFDQSIAIEEIIYLESDGNYTKIYLSQNKKKVAAKSLCHIQADLKDSGFLRINRSQAVNKRYVTSYSTMPHFALLKLRNGDTLKTSRRRTLDFLNAIKTFQS